MSDNYRQRATKAEHENVRLRRQLAREPNHKWFVDLIRKHLGQAADVHPSKLAFQVKQLKEARGPGVEKHNQTREALKSLFMLTSYFDEETCMCGSSRESHDSPLSDGHSFTPMLSYHLHQWHKDHRELIEEITPEIVAEETQHMEKPNDH